MSKGTAKALQLCFAAETGDKEVTPADVESFLQPKKPVLTQTAVILTCCLLEKAGLFRFQGEQHWVEISKLVRDLWVKYSQIGCLRTTSQDALNESLKRVQVDNRYDDTTEREEYEAKAREILLELFRTMWEGRPWDFKMKYRSVMIGGEWFQRMSQDEKLVAGIPNQFPGTVVGASSDYTVIFRLDSSLYGETWTNGANTGNYSFDVRSGQATFQDLVPVAKQCVFTLVRSNY